MRVAVIGFLLALANAEEYLITLKTDGSFQKFMDSSVQHGTSVKQFFGNKISRTFTIGSFRGVTMELSRDLLNKVKRNPFVADVVPNILVKAFDDQEESDDNYDNQYTEDEIEEYRQVIKKQKGAPRHLARISRRRALPFDFDNGNGYKDSFNYYYEKENQGGNVRAYILDSGIYKEHEDFDGRVEVGVDFTGEGPGDNNGHGTHVAGIVGSNTFGVAKDVTLVDVKCLDSMGRGSLITVLAAIEFTVNDCHKYADKKCVANLSLGAIKNNIINKAVKAATEDGVVMVVAAGNFNMNACWSSPASAKEAITVGAFDDRIDTIAKFSNWGPCVDIFAPGVAVASLSNKQHEQEGDYDNENDEDDKNDDNDDNDDNDSKRYVVYSGTSMASPNVCGMAALLLDQGYPEYMIRDVLITMATDNVFQRRTLVFKPNTPNRILYNGINIKEDQYSQEHYVYPNINIDELIDELNNYSPVNNNYNTNNNNRNTSSSTTSDILLPLGSIKKRSTTID